MRKITLLLLLTVSCNVLFSQINAKTTIDKAITMDLALEPFRFLAADELMGRSALRPEINIAARYIAEQFRSAGVAPVEGADEYYQQFPMRTYFPASSGAFNVGNTTYNFGKNLLQVQGSSVNLNVPIVFVGNITVQNLAKADIKGKIVVLNLGDNDSSSFSNSFRGTFEKFKTAKESGAVAAITRYRKSEVKWEDFQHYLGHPRMYDDKAIDFPSFYVNDTDADLPSLIKENTTAALSATGAGVSDVPAKNVVGYIEGSDPKLKNEYILLSAHYDHVGVAVEPKMEEGKMDSIFNGARDNAIGVTAVINAAKYFSRYPPKRSILFIAFTAEELGLVGSRFYSEHPLIPLNKVVYNLNIDNASYNDTTIVTVVGLGRTSADNDIKRSATAYGLKATPDPAPEQGLFDRSDNVNFAVKGVPSPTYSLGVKKFDETITKRYHQMSDEVGNFSSSYALKYIRVYILTAKAIADNPVAPSWVKGDKYEEAWKALYEKGKK